MAACDSCHSYKAFGNKCWFYWKGKKTCTQHRKAPNSQPEFFSEELEIRV